MGPVAYGTHELAECRRRTGRTKDEVLVRLDHVPVHVSDQFVLWRDT